MNSNDNSGLVYSTGSGRMCPGCGKPKDHCECRKESAISSNHDGIVRVRLETQGRKGKGVTLVTGLELGGEKLETLAKKLKQHCSAGGTIRNGVVEIQGDHRENIIPFLLKEGFKAKRI